MDLVEELAKLHEVQKIDTQIFKREQALKAQASGEAEKQKAIGLLKEYDAAQATRKSLETGLKDRELALKSVEAKRDTVHERLYSGRVHNPKELGDLQIDEESLNAHIRELEEPLLTLMDQVETARASTTRLANEVSDAKRRWKEVVARSTAETTRLQQEIAALRPERAQQAALVDKSLLRRYDDIRQRRDGIGMAMTANDSCPICHIKLTSNLVQKLREKEELTYCENCGCILAWMGY